MDADLSEPSGRHRLAPPQHLFSVFRTDVEVGHWIERPVENSHLVGSIRLMSGILPIPLRTLGTIQLSIAIATDSEVLATANLAMATAAHALDLHVFNFER